MRLFLVLAMLAVVLVACILPLGPSGPGGKCGLDSYQCSDGTCCPTMASCCR